MLTNDIILQNGYIGDDIEDMADTKSKHEKPGSSDTNPESPDRDTRKSPDRNFKVQIDVSRRIRSSMLSVLRSDFYLLKWVSESRNWRCCLIYSAQSDQFSRLLIF